MCRYGYSSDTCDIPSFSRHNQGKCNLSAAPQTCSISLEPAPGFSIDASTAEVTMGDPGNQEITAYIYETNLVRHDGTLLEFPVLNRAAESLFESDLSRFPAHLDPDNASLVLDCDHYHLKTFTPVLPSDSALIRPYSYISAHTVDLDPITGSFTYKTICPIDDTGVLDITLTLEDSRDPGLFSTNVRFGPYYLNKGPTAETLHWGWRVYDGVPLEIIYVVNDGETAPVDMTVDLAGIPFTYAWLSNSLSLTWSGSSLVPGSNLLSFLLKDTGNPLDPSTPKASIQASQVSFTLDYAESFPLITSPAAPWTVLTESGAYSTIISLDKQQTSMQFLELKCGKLAVERTTGIIFISEPDITALFSKDCTGSPCSLSCSLTLTDPLCESGAGACKSSESLPLSLEAPAYIQPFAPPYGYAGCTLRLPFQLTTAVKSAADVGATSPVSVKIGSDLKHFTAEIAVLNSPGAQAPGSGLYYELNIGGNVRSAPYFFYVNVLPGTDTPPLLSFPASLVIPSGIRFELDLFDYVWDSEQLSSDLIYSVTLPSRPSGLLSWFTTTSNSLIWAVPEATSAVSIGITVTDQCSNAVSASISITVAPALDLALPSSFTVSLGALVQVDLADYVLVEGVLASPTIITAVSLRGEPKTVDTGIMQLSGHLITWTPSPKVGSSGEFQVNLEILSGLSVQRTTTIIVNRPVHIWPLSPEEKYAVTGTTWTHTFTLFDQDFGDIHACTIDILPSGSGPVVAGLQLTWSGVPAPSALASIHISVKCAEQVVGWIPTTVAYEINVTVVELCSIQAFSMQRAFVGKEWNLSVPITPSLGISTLAATIANPHPLTMSFSLLPSSDLSISWLPKAADQNQVYSLQLQCWDTSLPSFAPVTASLAVEVQLPVPPVLTITDYPGFKLLVGTGDWTKAVVVTVDSFAEPVSAYLDVVDAGITGLALDPEPGPNQVIRWTAAGLLKWGSKPTGPIFIRVIDSLQQTAELEISFYPNNKCIFVPINLITMPYNAVHTIAVTMIDYSPSSVTILWTDFTGTLSFSSLSLLTITSPGTDPSPSTSPDLFTIRVKAQDSHPVFPQTCTLDIALALTFENLPPAPICPINAVVEAGVDWRFPIKVTDEDPGSVMFTVKLEPEGEGVVTVVAGSPGYEVDWDLPSLRFSKYVLTISGTDQWGVSAACQGVLLPNAPTVCLLPPSISLPEAQLWYYQLPLSDLSDPLESLSASVSLSPSVSNPPAVDIYQGVTWIPPDLGSDMLYTLTVSVKSPKNGPIGACTMVLDVKAVNSKQTILFPAAPGEIWQRKQVIVPSGLTEGVPYSLPILVEDMDSLSSLSARISAVTDPSFAAPPLSFTDTSTTIREFTLSWTPPNLTPSSGIVTIEVFDTSKPDNTDYLDVIFLNVVQIDNPPVLQTIAGPGNSYFDGDRYREELIWSDVDSNYKDVTVSLLFIVGGVESATDTLGLGVALVEKSAVIRMPQFITSQKTGEFVIKVCDVHSCTQQTVSISILHVNQLPVFPSPFLGVSVAAGSSGSVVISASDYEGKAVTYCLDSGITDVNDGKLLLIAGNTVEWREMGYSAFTSQPFTVRATDERTTDCASPAALFTSQTLQFCRAFHCNAYPQAQLLTYYSAFNQVTIHLEAGTAVTEVYMAFKLTNCASLTCAVSGDYAFVLPIIVRNGAGYSVPMEDIVSAPALVLSQVRPEVAYSGQNCEILVSGSGFLPSVRCYQLSPPLELYVDYISSTLLICITSQLPASSSSVQLELRQAGQTAQSTAIRVCNQPVFHTSAYTGQSLGGYVLPLEVDLGCWDTGSVVLLFGGKVLQILPSSALDEAAGLISAIIPPQFAGNTVSIAISTTPSLYIWSTSTAQLTYSSPCMVSGQLCANTQASVACSTGHYCDTAMSSLIAPIPCPPGTYQDIAGEAQCKQCPVGYMCDNEGLVNPVPCLNGFICDKTGISWPIILCPVGSYCGTGTNTRYISPVSATFTTATPFYTYETLFPRLSDPPSDHWFTRGQGFDSNRLDYYHAGASFDQQTYCPGYYGPPIPLIGSVLIQPKQCPGGSFCGSGVGTETPNNADNRAPKDCSEGYICEEGDGESFDTRRLCTSGYYCPGVSGTGNTDCDVYPSPCRKCKCPKGASCPFSGMNAPALCAKGTYQELCTSSTCISCPSGYFCFAEGTKSVAEMTPCPAGNDCPTGSMKPIPCPTGTYKQLLGSSCQSCPVGFLCPEQGMISPVLCPAGIMCLAAGLLQGTQCPAGFYCPLGTNILQFPCPSSSAGQLCDGCELINPSCHCPTCPVQCPAGQMCPLGSPSPIPCSPGQYQDQLGQASCKTCASGYFCPSTGLTTMSICTAGYFCDQAGLIQPTGLCPSGFLCPAGTIYGAPEPIRRRLDTGPIRDCVGTNASLKPGSPLYCPKGFYCPAGSAQLATGVGGPVPCESGTYNQLCGQGSCSACPTGYSCTIDGTIDPAMCPVSSFSTSRSNRCDPCPIGTWGGTMMGKTQALECPACPAGYICASEGISATSQMRLCKSGFYCPAGSSVEINLCPAGFYCPAGTPSLEAARNNQCPAGRFCAEGTSATAVDIAACLDTEKPCLIGKICPQNYFCLAGTGERYEACPQDTISNSGAKSIDDCYINPKVPPKVYKAINALYIDPAATWNYTQEGLSLSPLNSYSLSFDISLFSHAVFLQDYLLVVELTEDNRQTVRIPLVSVDSFTPVQRVPIVLSLLTNSQSTIEFSILSHVTGEVKFSIEVLSGFYSYESFGTIFKNTVKVLAVTSAQRKAGYSFLAALSRASKDTFYEPVNTGLTQIIGKDPAMYKTYTPALVKPAVISLIAPDIVGDKAVPQSQVSFWDMFPQSQNLYPVDYVPYVSDCEGFGAYLPIYSLINHAKCTFIEVEDTIPVEILKITTQPHGDSCDFSLTCRFAEDFTRTADLSKEYWVGAYELSAFPVLAFTRPQLSAEDYTAAIPSLDQGTTSFDGRFFGSGELIQVIASRGTESYERGMHPASVHLDLGYYQKTRIDKELLQAKFLFSSFSKSNDRSFTFRFTLRALSWKDCLDLFGFQESLYYVFVLLLCLVIFAFVVLFWLVNYSLSRILPRPKLKIAIYLAYSGRAILGIFMAVLPLIGVIALIWFPLNSIKSLQSITGDFSFTEPINPSSSSDLDKV